MNSHGNRIDNSVEKIDGLAAMSKLNLRIIVISAISLILAILLYFGYHVGCIYYYQVVRAPVLHEELGFELTAPVILFDGVYRELVVLSNIDEAGYVYRAGLRNGDILACDESTNMNLTRYYRLIDSNRGKAVTLHVIGNAADYVTPKKFSRTVYLQIPQ